MKTWKTTWQDNDKELILIIEAESEELALNPKRAPYYATLISIEEVFPIPDSEPEPIIQEPDIINPE